MSYILTCTDGSLYAPSVYGHSAWVASRLNMGIKLLHALDAHREIAQGGDLTGAIGFNASAELTEELVRLEEAQARLGRLKGTAILEEGVKQLAGMGITDVHRLHRHGALADTVAGLETSVDFVVLGKRGEQCDSANGHLGAELERVIRVSQKPVLVASRAFKPIQSFLLAYDGGRSATKALDFVLTNPLLKGLECHVLRAGKIDDTAKHYLNESAEKLRWAGFSVRSDAISGAAEEVIASYVKEQQVDLLVMGAYGRTLLRQLILGSTTTAMVRTCLVPVLMFR